MRRTLAACVLAAAVWIGGCTPAPAPPDRPVEVDGRITRVQESSVLVEGASRYYPGQFFRATLFRRASSTILREKAEGGYATIPYAALAEGQRVHAWTNEQGFAESDPAQASIEAIVVLRREG